MSGGNHTIVFLRVSSAVTLLIKMGGFVIGGHEALFVNPPRDPVVFAVAAFMMAGATGLDSLLDKFIGADKTSKGAE